MVVVVRGLLGIRFREDLPINFTKGFSFACVAFLLREWQHCHPPFCFVLFFLSIILVSIPLEIKIKYYELRVGSLRRLCPQRRQGSGNSKIRDFQILDPREAKETGLQCDQPPAIRLLSWLVV